MSRARCLLPIVFLCFAGIVRAELVLPVTEHTLSNGMSVLAVERPDAPVVAFALYYRVGSVDEKPGKTGLAHYCEHMMFKSTESLQGESFAKLMATIGGGHSNANTSFDRTMYHQTVSPDRLEFVIRLEAERMAHLNPTPEETAAELEVVKEELRLNYLDNPTGRMRFELHQHAYDVHPYKTITIGHLDDLASISRDDLLDFQNQYYVPANAVAVIVGRFEMAAMLDLMETHFGRLKPGSRAERRYSVEPEQVVERRFELDMPVRRSLLWMGYHTPSAAHPDSLPLQVLAAILGNGGSSPFGRLAQGPDSVAMYVSAWNRPMLEPGLFMISGMTLPGVIPEILENRIENILREIIEKGISPEQLEIARTQLIAEETYKMQSCMGIAECLGEAEMVTDWQDGIRLSQRLDAITCDTIRDVASRYLIPKNRTVGIARSAHDADTGGSSTGDSDE